MTIDGRTIPPGTPIYTFVDEEGGNTHIHSIRLREWCLQTNPEVFLVPIEKRLVDQFWTDNCITMKRVLALTDTERAEPIILAKWDESPASEVLLVDGHHRYARAWLHGQNLIDAWILTPAEWRPFEIVNVPILSSDVLRAMPPITKEQL